MRKRDHILVGFSSKRGSILGALTCWLTRWKHSHVVLIHEDGKTLIEATDEGGVRIMPISYLLARENVELRLISHPDPQGVWEECETQLGKPYDELYSFGWLFRRDWQDDNAWACHELIEWACRQSGCGLFPEGATYLTPRDLYLISEPL
jgi:uncharacterized protein YycO